jgi:hypothetical protein
VFLCGSDIVFILSDVVVKVALKGSGCWASAFLLFFE